MVLFVEKLFMIYGKFIGNKGVSLLTVCSMFLSLLSSFFNFYEVLNLNIVIFIYFFVLFLTNLLLYDFIMWMKTIERLKKIYSNKQNLRQHTQKKYSTDQRFSNKGKKKVEKEMESKNINPNGKIDTVKVNKLKKEFEQQVKHPTYIERGETNGEYTKLYIVNTTGSSEPVPIGGKIIEVPQIGTNHKSGFRGFVKVVTTVDVKSKDLLEGQILEENKFEFGEEEKREDIEKIREIINKEEVGSYNWIKGEWSKNDKQFTSYETSKEFFEKIKEEIKDYINKG
jgi:hypothetical protein